MSDVGRGNRGGRWVLYLDGAVFLWMLVYLWLFVDPFGWIAFWCGYRKTGLVRFQFVGWLIVLFPFFLGGVVYVLGRLIRVCLKRGARRRPFFVLLGIFGLGAGLVVAAGHSGRPPMCSFLEGFARQVRERWDTEEIREWANSLDASVFNGEMHDYMFHPERAPVVLPEFLGAVEPPIHYLRFAEEQDGRSVEICWGGGLFHWGLVVGPSSLTGPAEATPGFEYTRWILGVENGVVVWGGH